MTFLSRCLWIMVRAYQIILSPLMGGQCRFHPSCSAYALEALEIHGPWSGTSLAIRRVLRCHPWHPGGVDLVPRPAGTAPAGVAPAGAASTERD